MLLEVLCATCNRKEGYGAASSAILRRGESRPERSSDVFTIAGYGDHEKKQYHAAGNFPRKTTKPVFKMGVVVSLPRSGHTTTRRVASRGRKGAPLSHALERRRDGVRQAPPADPELREKLTTLVGRLTADLGIGGGRSAEGLAAASVAMLSKMTSPYDVTKVAVQQTQKTLTENAPDKRAFASEYARLKAMNVRELDKYLNVVAKIVQDPDLLAAVSTPRAPTRDDEADSSRRASRDIVPPAAPAAPPAEARDDPRDHRHDRRAGVDDDSRFDFSDAPGVSDAGGADVTSLPMDSFSFSTNPLASEETGPGSSGGTPRASGLRRMDEVESDPRGGGLDPRSRRPAIDEAPSAAAQRPQRPPSRPRRWIAR